MKPRQAAYCAALSAIPLPVSGQLSGFRRPGDRTAAG